VESLCVPLESIPPAVLCVGLNYKKHAAETGMSEPLHPVVFMKNPAALLAHGREIVIPTVCDQPDKPEVDYEAELAVVIGWPALNVPASDALDHVLGFTAANDVSARRWQGKKGGTQWCRAKSFDTFCPLGPELLFPDMLHNPNEGDGLRLQTYVNGKKLQDSNTLDMIFSVANLISFLSQGTTLLPGTVILTGTPEGVGYTRDPPVLLRPGDEVSVQLGHMVLKNQVVGELQRTQTAGTGLGFGW